MFDGKAQVPSQIWPDQTSSGKKVQKKWTVKRLSLAQGKHLSSLDQHWEKGSKEVDNDKRGSLA